MKKEEQSIKQVELKNISLSRVLHCSQQYLDPGIRLGSASIPICICVDSPDFVDEKCRNKCRSKYPVVVIQPLSKSYGSEP